MTDENLRKYAERKAKQIQKEADELRRHANGIDKTAQEIVEMAERSQPKDLTKDKRKENNMNGSQPTQ